MVSTYQKLRKSETAMQKTHCMTLIAWWLVYRNLDNSWGVLGCIALSVAVRQCSRICNKRGRPQRNPRHMDNHT